MSNLGSRVKGLSIEEYYLKEVYSKGGKYQKGHPVTDRLVLCPLHDDKNPSMGFIHGKDGVEKFHCFGCGRAGDVVDLHMGLRDIKDEERALKEVCDILGVEYKEALSEKEEINLFYDRLSKIRTYNTSSTEASFSRYLRQARTKEERNRVLLNTLWLKEDIDGINQR